MTSRRRSWRSLLLPALLAFAVLIALGTWQIERKAWKENLIASLTARLAAPPEALPAPKTWSDLDRASNEYRRVEFGAEFDYGHEALVYGAASAFRPDVSGPGYWVFTPARLADGSVVMGDISASIVETDGDQIEPRHLMFFKPRRRDPTMEKLPLAGKTLESIERNAIAQTLEQCGGNKTKAAKQLGISPSTLYEKVKKYKL